MITWATLERVCGKDVLSQSRHLYGEPSPRGRARHYHYHAMWVVFLMDTDPVLPNSSFDIKRNKHPGLVSTRRPVLGLRFHRGKVPKAEPPTLEQPHWSEQGTALLALTHAGFKKPAPSSQPLFRCRGQLDIRVNTHNVLILGQHGKCAIIIHNVDATTTTRKTTTIGMMIKNWLGTTQLTSIVYSLRVCVFNC